MRNSATGLTRSGISDWLVQRLSAYILGLYFVIVLGFIACTPGMTYEQWHSFMTCPGMRVFGLVALVGLVAHAWVGMWTVFTDYVNTHQMGDRATFPRLVLIGGTVLANLVFLIWGFQILWGN